MAENEQVIVRKADGSGSGFVLDAASAKQFLKDNEGYEIESAEEAQAKQDAADEQVAQGETTAPAPPEGKAVAGPPENKAVTQAAKKSEG